MKQQAQPRKKKSKLLWVALSIALFSAVFACYTPLSRHFDRQRFSRADKIQTQVVDDMMAHLTEGVMSVRKQNQCFSTQQGPYDNGKLWCQVGTVVKLNKTVDFASLGDVFVNSSKDLGQEPVSSNNYGVTRFWFPFSKSLSCSLIMSSSDGNTDGSATTDPFAPGDVPAFAVTCSDRAKARHYKYVD